jgi:hypothetical protein
MNRSKILSDLEDIQRRVDEMGFKGSNEYELYTREEVADYIQNLLSQGVITIPVSKLKLEINRLDLLQKSAAEDSDEHGWGVCAIQKSLLRRILERGL